MGVLLSHQIHRRLMWPDNFNWYSEATAPLEAWVWMNNTCFDWNEI